MAVPWLTILKTVPWTDVIAKAPEVAASARKLWNTVGRKQTVDDAVPTPTDEVPQHNPLTVLEERLGRSEQSVEDLRVQLADCSKLLAEIAEQNSLLIARVDAERRKSVWIALAAGSSLALAITSLMIAAS